MSNPAAEKTVEQPAVSASSVAQFERIYRDNVGAVTAYFARRCSEPQEVADLVSETMLRAAGSFGRFDRARGTPRAWLFGIAAHVYAHSCRQTARGREAETRLANRRALQCDETEELAAKIDAQRAGRELLARCARLDPDQRAAIELVDLDGLTPQEAAAVLGVSRGALRMRLSRARARLRKEQEPR